MFDLKSLLQNIFNEFLAVQKRLIVQFRGFHQVWYQGIVKATVSGVFEDLKYKVSEGSEFSKTLKLRSADTPKTVAFTIP